MLRLVPTVDWLVVEALIDKEPARSIPRWGDRRADDRASDIHRGETMTETFDVKLVRESGLAFLEATGRDGSARSPCLKRAAWVNIGKGRVCFGKGEGSEVQVSAVAKGEKAWNGRAWCGKGRSPTGGSRRAGMKG